jgi:type IV pilus assembly protein PilC
MATSFIYRARNAENHIVTGKVQAANMDAARKVLTEHKLIPISVQVPKSAKEIIPFFHMVSLKEKTLFARQLATMIQAGLTLAQSLRILSKQSRKGRFQQVQLSLLSDIQEGFNFSTALAKFPDVFDPVFINVIQSGEATGKLELVLNQLSLNMEKEVAIRSKVRGALFYPAFVLIVMVVVGLIMTTKVIPQLKDVFLSAGKDLPTSTKLLVAISDFMISYWYIALAAVIATSIAARAYFITPSGQKLYSRASLKIPVAGTIIEETSMARFGRLLGLLLESGVPLLEALRLITDSFTNRLYQDSMAGVASDVERGIPMSAPISENRVFPLMVGQMVAVGEQTGKMDEVMIKLAEYYESEVEAKVAGLASLIEPMVIVLLGIGVAWLVQAILLPIYQISSAV